MGITLHKRKTKKVVHLLYDVKPELVSIVDHGANQTPFTVIKAEAGDLETLDKQQESEMEVRVRNKAVKSEVKQEVSEQTKAIKSVDIASISFSADVFREEKAVTDWLANKGFSLEDVPVVKSEEYNNYSVSVSDSGGEETHAIEADQGVTIKAIVRKEQADAGVESEDTVAGVADTAPESPESVAQKEDTAAPAKADEEDSEAEEPTEVSESPSEFAQKFDDWMAEYSDKETLAGVLMDADDGFPAGVRDLSIAFFAALKNCTIKRDNAAIDSLIAEFGEKYKMLASIMMEFPEESTAKAEKPVKAAESLSQEIIAEAVAQAVKSAVSEISNSFAESVKEMKDSVSKSVGEVAHRIHKLESVSQTRKGADVDDAGVDNRVVAVKKTDHISEKLRANELGISIKTL